MRKFEGKVVLIADIKQESGRIYPLDELVKNVDELNSKPIIGTFIGLDSTDPSKNAIRCTNFKMNGVALVCDFEVLSTPYGQHLIDALEVGHNFELSPVGVGVVEDDIVRDYKLTSVGVKLA